MFGFSNGFKPYFGWKKLLSSGSPPVNTAPPSLLRVGNNMVATPGTWTGTLPITYSYVFEISTNGGSSWSTLQSGASTTYPLVGADQNSLIRVRELASNAFSPSPVSASSNDVSIGQLLPLNSVAPVLSGLGFVGQTLTATSGTWSGTPPITYNYVFFIAGVAVLQSSASNTYVVDASAAGQTILCNVQATNAFGGPVVATSNGIAIKATILDLYPTGAERCYYLTLQRGAYYGNPCIRVRRSGDSAETNIGFTTTGVLDTSALQSFVVAGGGSQNGFIVTYFDQSLVGVNATQTTPSKQAQIVSGGVVMTNAGLPISDYIDANAQEYTAATARALPIYTFFHYSLVTTGGGRSPVGFSQFPTAVIVPASGVGFRNSGALITFAAVSTLFVKRAWSRNGANGSFYRDGSLIGNSTALQTTTGNMTSYMNQYFANYTTEKVRGTIVYNTELNATQIAAINNLLD